MARSRSTWATRLTEGSCRPITLAVGPGISDVSVADVNQDGRPDILLANQTSGEVEVILNLGDGRFSQPTLYRAGLGSPRSSAGTGTTPLSLFSQDGTVGVAAAALDAGRASRHRGARCRRGHSRHLDRAGRRAVRQPVFVADDRPHLWRFASPTSMATATPTWRSSARTALTIWLGNGQGGFVQGNDLQCRARSHRLDDRRRQWRQACPTCSSATRSETSSCFWAKATGVFRPPTITDQSVALAVTYPNGSSTPTFIFSDQASDSVVVKSASQTLRPCSGTARRGLLVPGAPVLADLNGDGIPDLIVANTGGNNVLVYPGLPGGGFGPALNDGNGFPTGTNPVAVIVANLNGRPDLIVANEGSNDVSILLNEPDGNSFTFVPGPRLSVGQGPVGLLYGDFYGNGTDDLVVSDSGSNNLMVLPSLGQRILQRCRPDDHCA